MVLVSLVDPRLLLGPPDILLWGMKCRDNCDNIFVNPFLGLKVSFIVDPMESVELAVRDILDILWWPQYSFPCSANN